MGAAALAVLAGYFAYRVWRSLFKNFGRPPGRVRYTRSDAMGFLRYALELENQQIAYYSAQRRAAAERLGDEHLAAALGRMEEVERGHVRRIRDGIRALGASPGPPPRASARVPGAIAGAVTGRLGRGVIARSIVWIEQKAVDHYLRARAMTGAPALRALFMDNLVDEEFHAAFAQEMLRQELDPRQEDRFSRPGAGSR